MRVCVFVLRTDRPHTTDGTLVALGLVVEETSSLTLRIGAHFESLSFDLISSPVTQFLGNYLVVKTQSLYKLGS